MKGVILAAGKGTRLYPVTRVVPKPILPIANRPTIYYAFDRLKEMGINDICVVVGEMETQMREFLRDGSARSVRLSFVRQVEPKGLAHALSFAREFVARSPFVLYLGDAIYGGGFEKFAQRFRASRCANLNIVKPVSDPWRFGVAELDGERIVRLVEKPKEPKSNLAMAGLYFFGPEIWDVLPALQPSARGEYEITDAIQMLIDRGERVLAGIYEDEWFDTGTLDSFLEASAFLSGGRSIVATDADVTGVVGQRVVVGEGAKVRCEKIEDAVVLPGSAVDVAGLIKHAIIGGEVKAAGPVEGKILQGAALAEAAG